MLALWPIACPHGRCPWGLAPHPTYRGCRIQGRPEPACTTPLMPNRRHWTLQVADQCQKHHSDLRYREWLGPIPETLLALRCPQKMRALISGVALQVVP